MEGGEEGGGGGLLLLEWLYTLYVIQLCMNFEVMYLPCVIKCCDAKAFFFLMTQVRISDWLRPCTDIAGVHAEIPSLTEHANYQ